MKKKDIRDLIVSHYEQNDFNFFNTSLRILKELKDSPDEGDRLLERDIEFHVLGKVKIRPKPEKRDFVPEISFEDAEEFKLTPQGEDNGQ